MAFDKTVTIRPRNTDRYGRTVAEVILPDGQSLNRVTTWRGYAWWYRSYALNDCDLAALESSDKDAKSTGVSGLRWVHSAQDHQGCSTFWMSSNYHRIVRTVIRGYIHASQGKRAE